jgi:hypothetical protein
MRRCYLREGGGFFAARRAMMAVEALMDSSLRKTLYWVPRVGSISFILFASIFPLMIADMQVSVLGIVFSGFLHMTGTFGTDSIVLAVIGLLLMVISILITWRWEWLGAVAHIGIAFASIGAMRGVSSGAYLLFVAFPLIIGLFFAVGWAYRQQIRSVD